MNVTDVSLWERCPQALSATTFLLAVFTRSGRAYGGRLLPATARAGFLLSPVVENRQSFFALASTNWQHELAGLEVT